MARYELRKALAEWGMTAVGDSAALVLSELMTNAVVHARVPGRQIETRFMREDGDLRIEVHDATRTVPAQRVPERGANSGRGLALVASLSAAWGVSPRSGVGKLVWALLKVPAEGRWG
ncbi:ATP-binding protein [Streptomyces sp. ET3-23]|nr:ATP-binding protein [Streptomyces sp. ET3-23]